MKNYLWTGESVFCVCGHHVEYHKTTQSLMATVGVGDFMRYKCHYPMPDFMECQCTGFKPYRKIEK